MLVLPLRLPTAVVPVRSYHHLVTYLYSCIQMGCRWQWPLGQGCFCSTHTFPGGQLWQNGAERLTQSGCSGQVWPGWQRPRVAAQRVSSPQRNRTVRQGWTTSDTADYNRHQTTAPYDRGEPLQTLPITTDIRQQHTSDSRTVRQGTADHNRHQTTATSDRDLPSQTLPTTTDIMDNSFPGHLQA